MSIMGIEWHIAYTEIEALWKVEPCCRLLRKFTFERDFFWSLNSPAHSHWLIFQEPNSPFIEPGFHGCLSPVARHMSTLITHTHHPTLVRTRPPVLVPSFHLPPCLCCTFPCVLIQSLCLSLNPSPPHTLKSSVNPTSSRKSILTRVIDSQMSEI